MKRAPAKRGGVQRGGLSHKVGRSLKKAPARRGKSPKRSFPYKEGSSLKRAPVGRGSGSGRCLSHKVRKKSEKGLSCEVREEAKESLPTKRGRIRRNSPRKVMWEIEENYPARRGKKLLGDILTMPNTFRGDHFVTFHNAIAL